MDGWEGLQRLVPKNRQEEEEEEEERVFFCACASSLSHPTNVGTPLVVISDGIEIWVAPMVVLFFLIIFDTCSGIRTTNH